MANTNQPMGFIPAYNTRLGTCSPNTRGAYSIASAYGTALYPGDPVKFTGTADAAGRQGIQRAAAGDTVCGIFAGVEYVDASGVPQQPGYWAASTVATQVVAYVYDDPNIVFEVQGDEDIVAADIGATADCVAGTGSAVTKRSGYMLDSSDIGTGAGLLILGLVKRADNEFGNYAKVHVQLNEHTYRGVATGV